MCQKGPWLAAVSLRLVEMLTTAVETAVTNKGSPTYGIPSWPYDAVDLRLDAVAGR
ncbi:hypothetical protein GCM10010483_19420 [Actinokineospora diospyrosa]